ncbi:hypothetical protein CKO42_21065 [Lamprobacter modestohalophilus]|uniref:DUF1576 domain-containing protein n=1 Tax=Lamprobacter modestohalophilus TaxID=1064514 RepID=A0A9X0WCG4_9GAMM|nr:DUF1576 domain-containing protein [Lamprobacter modestohalophilus]MBK1620872.1 hypothetical protein [Lamprobacter modestohalophilus]
MGTDHALPSGTGASVAPSDRIVLLIVAGYALAFVLFGLLIDTPSDVLHGLGSILISRDTLLTDYMGVGGIGAALVSTGLLTLAACLVYALNRVRMTGTAIAALFLVLGFGLFGKNLLNVWFIIAGVALHARWRGQPFSTHINTAFFGIALSPIVSEILFSTTLPLSISLPLAVVTGLLIGFILPAAAAQLFRAHDGFALYNMGFTAGLVGTLVVAIYASYGFVADPVFIWTTGNNLLLGSFVGVLLLSMVLLGVVIDRRAFSRFWLLMRASGQAPSDFLASAGLGATLINMGLSGAVGLVYLLAIGGDLNGPTIGALFSIVGFAAFGKHPRNIIPIIAGVFLGSLAKPWGVADPSVQLAALFGTNLAPIAGYFGWQWGIIAGFIHSSAALSVGVVHGGLNLYNNGFAAGIVASILVPVILAIRARGGLTGRKPASGAVKLGASEPSVREPTKKISESVVDAQTGAGLTDGDGAGAGSRPGMVSTSGADDHVAHKQAAQAVALGRGRWLGAVLLRALFFLVIWLLLSAPDLGALRTLLGSSAGLLATGFGAEIGAGAGIAADVVIGAGAGIAAGVGIGDGINAQLAADLAIALIATAMATWISLWVLPPGPRPWRLSALMALMGRFLVQSVLGGIDVARRAFDPRLPLRPGYIVFASSLRRPHQRAILQTFASATPGAIAAGTDAEGRLVFHCLDTRGPIAEGLAQDEQLLLRLYREEEPK